MLYVYCMFICIVLSTIPIYSGVCVCGKMEYTRIKRDQAKCFAVTVVAFAIDTRTHQSILIGIHAGDTHRSENEIEMEKVEET